VIRDAFDNDLDTVAALDLLRSMESRQDVPVGAKFETFLFVDHGLGLELPREIGR
jgi:cysteinyl-tRNA synthetase